MENTEQKAPRKSKWRRRLVALSITVVVLLGVFAWFLPYLLKRYIESHSVEWIDRKVTIGSIVLNPFTFTYSVNGVTCTEPKSDAVFVSWEKIQVKSNLWKGFRSNQWRFRELRIVKPYFHITQKGDRFNFSDLMELGGSDTAKAHPADTAHVVFSMEDIQLSNGRIVYAMDLLKEPAEVIDLNVACNRITTESARMDFDLSLALAKGGNLKGGFMIDTDRWLYEIRPSS